MTLGDVIDYMEWLGSQDNKLGKIAGNAFVAAGTAIHAHEQKLTNAMIYGTGNLPGLAAMEGVHIIGGIDNPAREGLVSFNIDRLSRLIWWRS